MRDTIGTHAHCLYRGEKEKRKKKKEKRKEQENTAYSYVNRGGKKEKNTLSQRSVAQLQQR